eukprot:COSAG04_NODE_722_length_10806_cov_152.374708_9_plen_116_part_00
MRKTNVKELRAIRSSRSQRQGDAAIDFFGPMQETAVIDFVVVHPLAASYSTRYGQAGDAAKAKEEYKHGKYDEAAAAVGVRVRRQKTSPHRPESAACVIGEADERHVSALVVPQP